MPSLGEQLRAQRERKAITLEQAAADTRIREKFLKALEEGDYPSLPGAVYTRGFLRNYSDYLDLATDDLVVLYQQERGGAPPEPAPKRSSFTTTVSLKPGSNHVVVEVLDAAGKTNRVSRTIQYQAPAVGVSAPPVLAVEQPANGATFTNTYVQVSGRVDRGVTVQINTVP